MGGCWEVGGGWVEAVRSFKISLCDWSSSDLMEDIACSSLSKPSLVLVWYCFNVASRCAILIMADRVNLSSIFPMNYDE